MRSRRVKVYFDQEGLLVSHFKLQQTPARIQREGDKLRIEELKPW
jgi:conjugal transfer pilus assembly protein TraW